jgi:hypothetical protein
MCCFNTDQSGRKYVSACAEVWLYLFAKSRLKSELRRPERSGTPVSSLPNPPFRQHYHLDG